MSETIVVENRKGEQCTVINTCKSKYESVIDDRIERFSGLREQKKRELSKLQDDITQLNNMIDMLTDIKDTCAGKNEEADIDPGLKAAYMADII